MLLHLPGGLNPSEHIQIDMRESAFIHHTITTAPTLQCNSLNSKVKCSVCVYQNIKQYNSQINCISGQSQNQTKSDLFYVSPS